MNDNAYGLWALAAFNSMLFIIFAASSFQIVCHSPVDRQCG